MYYIKCDFHDLYTKINYINKGVGLYEDYRFYYFVREKGLINKDDYLLIHTDKSKCDKFIKVCAELHPQYVDLTKEHDEYIELYRGLLCLNEGLIFKQNGQKIYVNSNEKTNHNRPHVHVDIAESSAVIAIDNTIEIIEMSGKAKSKDYQIAIDYITKNIDYIRRFWDEKVDSHYKFNT